MEPAPIRKQRSKRESKQEGWIVADVEKAGMLAMVDQMEAEAVEKEMLPISHDENVSAWIEALNQWLWAAAEDQVQFAQLCQGLKMPPIEV